MGSGPAGPDRPRQTTTSFLSQPPELYHLQITAGLSQTCHHSHSAALALSKAPHSPLEPHHPYWKHTTEFHKSLEPNSHQTLKHLRQHLVLWKSVCKCQRRRTFRLNWYSPQFRNWGDIGPFPASRETTYTKNPPKHHAANIASAQIVSSLAISLEALGFKNFLHVKRASSIQHGHENCGTHARALSQTLAHGNSKNEMRQR